MLKNIPANISPELFKVLCEMKHSDEIVIGDGNFPATCNTKQIIRCDSQSVPEILESILKFFSLDKIVEQSVSVMDAGEFSPPIWGKYKEIISKYGNEENSNFEKIERFKFYERTKKAYAVIATSQAALYTNIILKKNN